MDLINYVSMNEFENSKEIILINSYETLGITKEDIPFKIFGDKEITNKYKNHKEFEP